MRSSRVALLLLGVVVLAGCGSETPETSGTAEGAYDGPMHLAVDHGDRATVLERSGAAGRALECRFDPYAGGSGDYSGGLETVQDDAQRALANWLDEEFVSLPHDGYRVEREDDGRVLLSYDVDGRTKVAVIAADGVRDWDGHEGWGVETWAQCDPAELPPSTSDDLGIGVWHTHDGDRVPVGTIQSYQGAEHCGWQDITFVQLGGDGEDRQVFLRDTSGELARWYTTSYDGHATLPGDATDTGFERDGRHLWLDRDGSAAYLVSTTDPHDVQRWPGEKVPIGCD